MIKARLYEKGDAFGIELRSVFASDFDTRNASELNALKEGNVTYTILRNDRIIGIVGLNLLWPGVAEGWSLLSEEVKKYPVAMHKLVLNGLPHFMEVKKLHRVQSTVVTDFCTGEKWLARLGFIKEGILHKFGAYGTNYSLWAKVV